MKILIADKIHPDVLAEFKGQKGWNVCYEPGLKAEELRASLEGTHVLLVRSTKVSAEAISEAKSLSLIVRAGAGVNTIDLEAANQRGVFVCNCPGKNSVAVAELAVGLLIGLDRNIALADRDLKAGLWNKKAFSNGLGIKGRTIGLIGLGAIGYEFARRCQALGARIIAWSRSLTPESAKQLGYGYCETPLEVARQASVVSVHVAYSKDTHHLCDASFFEALQPGSIFLNTSRGEVVDEEALLESLDQGTRAGLDVFAHEPGSGTSEWSSRIAQHPHVLGTPHIGASTEQSERATGQAAFAIVLEFAQGASPSNCVNLRERPTTGSVVEIRHEDRVGVLAGVLSVLRHHGINLKETENAMFEGGMAAVARLLVDGELSGGLVDELTACEGIIHVRAIQE